MRNITIIPSSNIEGHIAEEKRWKILIHKNAGGIKVQTWVRRDMAIASWPAPLTKVGAIIPPSSSAEMLLRNGGSSFIAATAAEFSMSLNLGAQATASASCCKLQDKKTSDYYK